MQSKQPDGYLATSTTGKGNPVLVFHAWWGLNETIKAFCRQLAESGFTAFAPDLYHGKVTDKIDEAEILSTAIFDDPQKARTDIAEAVAFIQNLAGPKQNDLAVIGFSLGAFFALDISVSAPDSIRSVVVFYGTRPGDYPNSKAAYLGHFAERDPFEPQTEVNNLEESLKQSGHPVSFHQYPDTGHWFFEPNRPQAYNQTAANLAWDRTLDFLNQQN